MKIIFKKPYKYFNKNKNKYYYCQRYILKCEDYKIEKRTTCAFEKIKKIKEQIIEKYQNATKENLMHLEKKRTYVIRKKTINNLHTIYFNELKADVERRKLPKEDGILQVTYDTLYYHSKKIQKHIPNFLYEKCENINQEWVEKIKSKLRNSQNFSLNKRIKCYNLIKKIIIKGQKLGWIENSLIFDEITRGRINKNKSDILPTPSKDQALQIINNLPYKQSVVTTVIAKTGIRISELNALQWQDIDVKKNLLQIKRTISGKGEIIKEGKTENAIRCIPINDRLIKLLYDYKKSLGNIPLKNDFIFTKKNGQPDTKETNYNAIKKVCIELGFTKKSKNKKGQTITTTLFGSHAFRRFFRTQCEKQGIHSLAIDYILGHSSKGSIGEKTYTDRQQLVEKNSISYDPLDT
tara:strand:- start:780 stop:2003 length:1224 start_codon:yes stop_codon:yes gene_type:complete